MVERRKDRIILVHLFCFVKGVLSPCFWEEGKKTLVPLPIHFVHAGSTTLMKGETGKEVENHLHFPFYKGAYTFNTRKRVFCV